MLNTEINSNVLDFNRADQADPYYRLAMAVIIQALTDLKSSDRFVMQKARWWLEGDGIIWWELLGFQAAILRTWLKREEI